MRKFFLLSLLFAVAGCQSLPPGALEGEPVDIESTSEPVMPFEEPGPPQGELDADLLFDYLLGEIAARQGDFAVAQRSYREAALVSNDAYAAERATLLSLHIKDLDAALEGASLWSQFAPNDSDARKYLGVLLLREGRFDEALVQLDGMRRIAEAKGNDGRLAVATVLAGEPDRKTARRALQELLADDPNAPDALYALALLDTAHGNLDQAEEGLVRALQARPEWPLARVLLSRVLVARKQVDQALEVLALGVKNTPEDKLLRKTYARLLIGAGRNALALKQFRVLHAANSDDVEVAYGYAMLATEQEALDEARGVWQELRGNAEYHAEASYFLAQIEEKAGNQELALGLYRGVTQGPLAVDAAIRAARLLQEMGRIDEARSLLRLTRLSNSKRETDLYLVEAQLLHADEAAQAIVVGVYAEALRRHPEDLDLLYNRGLYFSEVGRYKEMEADFRRVLQRDPENVNANNALGYMLAEQNIRLEEARGYIEKAYRREPELAAVIDSMGWVLYRLGDLEQAIRYLRAAHEKDPDDEIAAHLIEALWANGERGEARKLLQDASRKSPESDHLRQLRERLDD